MTVLHEGWLTRGDSSTCSEIKQYSQEISPDSQFEDSWELFENTQEYPPETANEMI